MKPVILRIDDIGASSKIYEQYGRSPFGPSIPFPLASLGLMKRLPGMRGWGPYREMRASEWEAVFDLLKKYEARLTVCVTACWVEKNGNLTPFPEKFPEEAATLKRGQQEGLIEIGNHGLTHCVVGKHLPQLLRGNRKYHREFWDYLPDSIHQEHLEKAQRILQDYFGTVVTLTPPGNQWTDVTEKYAKAAGLKFLSARFPEGERQPSLQWANRHPVYAFHDRELVLEGVSWLEKLLLELQAKGEQGCTVQELYG